MKSQGLNGLRTRSRSLLFLIINLFFPSMDAFGSSKAEAAGTPPVPVGQAHG